VARAASHGDASPAADTSATASDSTAARARRVAIACIGVVKLRHVPLLGKLA
jgi:hypothetical protein